MTRRPTENICTTLEDVPKKISERHGNVTLEIYIMAINKTPLMVTTSRNIHFRTAELIQDKTKNTIRQIVWTYYTKGFCVVVLADGGLNSLAMNYQKWILP